jgi:hypothetical protein
VTYRASCVTVNAGRWAGILAEALHGPGYILMDSLWS